MPPYRETPQTAQRRDAMRARLVAAARARMAAQGVAATTMQQVVADAGTSIGNCYFYFRDKDALFRAVAEELATEIGDEIEVAVARVAAGAAGDPADDAARGAAHLAVTTVVGMRATMVRAAEMSKSLVEANQPGIRELFLENFTRRLPAFLAVRFPDANVPLAVAAWQGASLAAEEVALAATVPPDIGALGRWLATWNLRALGLPDHEIAAALTAVDAALQEGGDGAATG